MTVADTWADGSGTDGRPTPSETRSASGVRVLTVAGYVLVVIATILSVPYLVLSGSYDYLWDDSPERWQAGLWGLAFFVGTASLTLGIVANRWAARLGYRRGRRWTTGLVFAATIGAMVWTLPVSAHMGNSQ
jgi:hypothetical protein